MPFLIYPIAAVLGVVGGGLALNYSLTKTGEGVSQAAVSAVPALIIAGIALYAYKKLK